MESLVRQVRFGFPRTGEQRKEVESLVTENTGFLILNTYNLLGSLFNTRDLMENIESIHTLLLKAGRNMLRESILETSQQTGKIFEAQQITLIGLNKVSLN